MQTPAKADPVRILSPDPDDVQNLMVVFLSNDTTLIKFSWTFYEFFQSYEPSVEMPYLIAVRSNGRRQAWVGGSSGGPWKSCKVFWCISNDSKMFSGRIIYELFSEHSSAESPQTSIRASFMDPMGTKAP